MHAPDAANPSLPALPDFMIRQPDAVSLTLKVTPRASRNEIGPVTGAELRIKVTAPPVDAAANEAVLRLLADTLDCPRSAVQLWRGQTARRKIVKIYGLAATDILARLAAAAG